MSELVRKRPRPSSVAQLEVVVDLAVVGDPVAAPVGHRLVAGDEVDDREPAVRERDVLAGASRVPSPSGPRCSSSLFIVRATRAPSARRSPERLIAPPIPHMGLEDRDDRHAAGRLVQTLYAPPRSGARASSTRSGRLRPSQFSTGRGCGPAGSGSSSMRPAAIGSRGRRPTAEWSQAKSTAESRSSSSSCLRVSGPDPVRGPAPGGSEHDAATHARRARPRRRTAPVGGAGAAARRRRAGRRGACRGLTCSRISVAPRYSSSSARVAASGRT